MFSFWPFFTLPGWYLKKYNICCLVWVGLVQIWSWSPSFSQTSQNLWLQLQLLSLLSCLSTLLLGDPQKGWLDCALIFFFSVLFPMKIACHIQNTALVHVFVLPCGIQKLIDASWLKLIFLAGTIFWEVYIPSSQVDLHISNTITITITITINRAPFLKSVHSNQRPVDLHISNTSAM